MDPETTTIKNAVLPKAVRNFVKINLDRTETVNEKNYNDQTATIKQETETPEESEEIDTTMTAHLLTTTESKPTTTRHPFIPDERNPKKPEPESNRSVLWFFGK